MSETPAAYGAASQPADMVTMEDLHTAVRALALGAYLNSHNPDAYRDGKALNAALDELAAARERIAALESDRATQPRLAIMAFARLMEIKLATKDALGYPDWRQETPLQHHIAINLEWQELNVELAANDGDGSRDAEARWEACDVALRAMMLCDVLEPLCEHDGRGRAKGTSDER